jgi:hypothetical protein
MPPLVAAHTPSAAMQLETVDMGAGRGRKKKEREITTSRGARGAWALQVEARAPPRWSRLQRPKLVKA